MVYSMYMTDKEQTAALASELAKVIERFKDEFDVSLAVAIGCP